MFHPALHCPNCRARLPSNGCCRCGSCYPEQAGLIRLLAGQQGRAIRAFAALIAAVRQNQQIPRIPVSAYPLLPFGPDAIGHEWRLRRHDLQLIRRLIAERQAQTILDLGAWNGWLSHHLAQDGHYVTAADYFDDPFDGLQARQWYPSSWRAVQCDLLDPALLGTYNLIIINRCLQFFGDPKAYLQTIQKQIQPGGLLIISGLQIFMSPQAKAAAVLQLQQQHRQRYGFELFLRPCKGFLDLQDAHKLRQLGITLRPYPIAANLRALIDPRRPLHGYGVQRTENKE